MQDVSLGKRIRVYIAIPLVRLLFKLIWSTCKVQRIIGEENIEPLLKDKTTFIPCHWHQHHFYGAWYMCRLIKRGIKIGFLISPSRDGEIPARIVHRWGAQVLRGSTTRGGAQTMRDMYNLVVKQRVSPVTTSDGPQGPAHVFKVGDLLLSQLTQAPLVPISYVTSKCWQMNSWDKYIIPKPFSRIVITIGAPYTVPKGLLIEDMEPHRLHMENTLKQLEQQARDALTS